MSERVSRQALAEMTTAERTAYVQERSRLAVAGLARAEVIDAWLDSPEALAGLAAALHAVALDEASGRIEHAAERLPSLLLAALRAGRA